MGCWVTVSIVADLLGASDRHFPEVMPAFLSEGKEMVPKADKGWGPSAKKNTVTLNSTLYLLSVLCMGD